MDDAAKKDLCTRLEDIKDSIYASENEAPDAMFGGRANRIEYYESQRRTIDEAIAIISALPPR